MAGEGITPERFVADWKGRNLTERAGSHAHFIQLCRLLGVPAPYDDPTSDDSYCFDAITAMAGILNDAWAYLFQAQGWGEFLAKERREGNRAVLP